ncbi:hypothetical protein [Methylorubrum populi]|jgi:hypothetical protein|uniref:hypothetical protein n=1 Tax=Methylorubrum populi TaxID=223967 RepID=UPI0010421D7C|nr:hypothetical protein [Methylorubrum populi]
MNIKCLIALALCTNITTDAMAEPGPGNAHNVEAYSALCSSFCQTRVFGFSNNIPRIQAAKSLEGDNYFLQTDETTNTDRYITAKNPDLLHLDVSRDLTLERDIPLKEKIPFANTASKLLISSHRTVPKNSILGTAAITRNTTGSGTFGP